jgi:cytochrome c peroxidase
MAKPFVHAAANLLLAVTGAAQIFPAPPQPAGNPSTPQKELLGKALFWDEQLSSTRTMACGTCHVFSHGGTDPRTGALHPGADGLFGTADDVRGSFGVVRQDATRHYVGSPAFGIARQVTGRKPPSPINAAYQPELAWDGRAHAVFVDPLTGLPVLAADAALESLASGPPLSDVEMSHLGRTWADIAADLPGLAPLALATNVPAALQAFVAGQTYAQLFQQVYGSPGVTPVRILFAIAAYERTLVSDQSPYDRSLVGQYQLTPTEQQGSLVFAALCTPCHTDVSPSVLTTGPVLTTFRNIGVRPPAEDQGRFVVTQLASDSGRFKVPSLRNVALRAPYFHTGGMATLTAVVDFYGRGGDFHQNQDSLVFNILGALSAVDKPRVVAFLNTLTDPRVQNELPPFDRPRLWSEGPNVPMTFGTGTAGSGGLPPRASAVPPPFVGNPAFTLGVDRTAPGAFPFLVFDFAANTTATNVLGHSVYLAQTPAMTSVAGQGLTLGAGPGGGFGSFTFALPNDVGLRGVSLFGQWLIVDALGPVGFASSNAFGLTIF